MVLHNYNLDHYFKNKFLNFWIYALSKLSGIKGIFRVRNTGAIGILSRKITEMYIKSEGLREISIKGEFSDYKKAYKEISAVLKMVRRFYYLLEKNKFFNQKDIQENAEKILQNIYKSEGSIRQKAFPKKGIPEDKELAEFATHISLSNLPG